MKCPTTPCHSTPITVQGRRNVVGHGVLVPTIFWRLFNPIPIREGGRLCLSHKLLSYQDFRHSGPPCTDHGDIKGMKDENCWESQGHNRLIFFWRNILIFIQLQFHEKSINHLYGVLQNHRQLFHNILRAFTSLQINVFVTIADSHKVIQPRRLSSLAEQWIIMTLLIKYKT